VTFSVVVAGGAGGIGRATARAFAAAGAQVWIGDIDTAEAERLAIEIGATALALDVRDPASFEALLVVTGTPDVLVNSAAVSHAAPFLDTPATVRDRQIDVNLRGVANGMAAVLPDMVVRDRGHVVNVASPVGKAPHAAIDAATKFAVAGLTEAVRAELHGGNVRVSAVLPTFGRIDPAAGRPHGGAVSLDPAEVAKTVLRVVRRGGPAVVSVPRWTGGLRLAGLTSQAVLEAMRRGVRDS
jgi:NADP-dependent 3-hydroxy acid dehydrogenase YdfG